jgi:hypothetical protein
MIFVADGLVIHGKNPFEHVHALCKELSRLSVSSSLTQKETVLTIVVPAALQTMPGSPLPGGSGRWR